jgi:hypothetical protein
LRATSLAGGKKFPAWFDKLTMREVVVLQLAMIIAYTPELDSLQSTQLPHGELVEPRTAPLPLILLISSHSFPMVNGPLTIRTVTSESTL